MVRAQKPGFIPELEATRGLAALVVAGFHAAQTAVALQPDGRPVQLFTAMRQSNAPLEAAAGHFFTALLNGEGAVLYFFVLSGFVLAASLELDRRPAPVLAWRFVLRRLFRIYPAVMAVVLIFALFHFATGLAVGRSDVFGPGSILRNMLLLDTTIDGVMWTMQVELLAIPVILAGFLCWRRGWTVLLFALATALAVLSYSGDWNRLFAGQSITQPLFAFAFGVYVRARGAAVVGRVPSRYRGLCALGALLVLAAAPLLGGSSHRMPVEAWSAAILLGILVYGQLPKVARLLSWPPIRFLGRISYGFYLLHPLGLAVIWRRPEFWEPIIEGGMPRPLLVLLLWAATAGAVVPIAFAVHRFVELPGIELGRRVCARLESRSAARPASETALLPQSGRVDLGQP